MEKPRTYLVGFKNEHGSYEDRPADDWREFEWQNRGIERQNAVFQWALDEIKRIFDEAAEKRRRSQSQSDEDAHGEFFGDENIHEHFPANHRGEDPNEIGTAPCDCAKDAKDKR